MRNVGLRDLAEVLRASMPIVVGCYLPTAVGFGLAATEPAEILPGHASGDRDEGSLGTVGTRENGSPPRLQGPPGPRLPPGNIASEEVFETAGYQRSPNRAIRLRKSASIAKMRRTAGRSSRSAGGFAVSRSRCSNEIPAAEVPPRPRAAVRGEGDEDEGDYCRAGQKIVRLVRELTEGPVRVGAVPSWSDVGPPAVIRPWGQGVGHPQWPERRVGRRRGLSKE